MLLSPTDVLTISAVLVGALVTIWGVWLRKEFSDNLGKFRIILRNYRKKRSKDLLGDIKKSMSARDEEEALNEISKYTDDWYFLTGAVAKLLDEDKRTYTWAKYVIILLALTFLMGIYTSGAPQELFAGTYTRLDILYLLFGCEILASLYWLWMFISLNRKMSTISTGKLEDVEEVVSGVISEVQKEEES